MGFKFNKSIVYISALILLSVFTVLCVGKIASNNKKLDAAAKSNTANSSNIESLTKDKNALQSRISELESQLADAQTNKGAMESEINTLKQQIEQLKIKKSEQQKAAASKKPSVPTDVVITPDGSRVCYLTFDDGPSDNTLQVLNILRENDIKATFFVIKNGKADYIKNIHAEGHAIGLHTATHNYETVYKSVENYYADLNDIGETVKSHIGFSPKIIRFPGGSSNMISKKYCAGIMSNLVASVREKGFQYFDWNVSSEDASSPKKYAQGIINSTLANAAGKSSICVLMHDAAAKTETVKALPGIISGLRNMGFVFKTLDENSPGFHHGVNN